MGAERLKFARYERSQAKRDQLPALTLLLLVLGVLMLTRSAWTPRVAVAALVAVEGEQGAVSFVRVGPGIVKAAVIEAGGAGEAPEGLAFGDLLEVRGDGVAVVPGAYEVLAGGRVDLNRADESVIAALPRVGARTAAAIVASREAEGPFFTLEDLRRVEGVGLWTIREIAPLVRLGDVGERPPLNLNLATAAELDRLPGIGPSFAARIVAEREANGPYQSVSELTRVSGLGEVMVGALSGLVEAP